MRLNEENGWRLKCNINSGLDYIGEWISCALYALSARVVMHSDYRTIININVNGRIEAGVGDVALVLALP